MPAAPDLEQVLDRRRRALCLDGAGEAEDLQDLAVAYARNPRPQLRERVAQSCQEWAAALARGVARGSSAEPDDLAQVALLAVLRALDRYDPDVGDFAPYARATVAGEVRHYLRATEWPLSVPRRYQDAYRRLAQARDALASAGASCPSERLAAAADIPAEDVDPVLALRRRTETLDAPSDVHLHERWLAELDPVLESVAERTDLQAAIDKLEPQHRQLLFLYYFRDTTQREMARALGTNQVRISRQLTKALATLRSELRP